MSYEQRNQGPEHLSTMKFYWWRRRRFEQDCSQQPRKILLPNPVLPTSIDLDVDRFISVYWQASNLEKAVLRPPQSHNALRSDTSTLTTTKLYSNPNKSSITQDSFELPPKCSFRMLRHFRLTIFTVYQRLFSLIFLANFIGLLLLLNKELPIRSINLDSLASWASTNFLVSILIRQDFVINAIFRTAWLIPWSVPLKIRRLATRCYTYGGIHSGAAVAGTMWWSSFTTMMSMRFAQQGQFPVPLLISAWLVLVLLISILVLAFPSLRAKHHDTFEMTHRFLGWSSILLFWAQLMLLIYHTSRITQSSFVILLFHSPTYWNLTIITLLLVYPWLRLRQWTFTSHLLSSHALRLSFPNNVHKFSCLSISTSPLKEWHPFATFPSTDPNQSGGSMVVSGAGDWTRSIIQNARKSEEEKQSDGGIRPKSNKRGRCPQCHGSMRFWIKGTTKAGVLSLSCIFSRVIILTTGSGIGPSLSSLIDRPPAQLCRLIWSTRSPLQTYGMEIWAEVQRADPDALIIDTTNIGRPDLVSVAWKMYKDLEAEAVFVLSNAKVTRKVVYGLESRGVPAFGPIWDS